MSYEIVKNISHRKKDDKIFITSASNNVWPRTYSKWEFMPNKENDKNKELYLFHGIIGGSYQLSGSVNENWRYAENKFHEYCRKNNISTSDIWEIPYKNDGNIELLKPYYEIFKGYLEEKKNGKFYLDSNIGIITKVNQRSFQYINYKGEPEKYCRSFKHVFNDYCNISKENREKYEIAIKEYNLNKELNDLGEIVEKGMEL